MSLCTLTIEGVPIDRVASKVVLNSLRFDCDEADSLEFVQIACGAGGGLWSPGAPVELEVPRDDGSGEVVRFKGEIVSTHPEHGGPAGYSIGYLCQGLAFVADRIIRVTNLGSPPGELTYNAPPGDPFDAGTLSGLSVGDILKAVLDLHAAQLAAVGIAGYVLADFAAMTIVPPSMVLMQGPLISALRGLLEQWSGVFCLVVRYEDATSDWRIRFLDTTAFADQNLTLGVDLVDPPSLGRDATQAASRLLVRGLGDIQGVWLSLADGSLFEAFPDPDGTPNPTGSPTVTAANKAAWSLYDFTQPKGAIDDGSVVSNTSTTATIHCTDATRTWGVNFWSGQQAWITLEITTSGTSLVQYESRRITACTAMTGGGTATITWDGATPVSATGFDRYRIVGQPVGGLNMGWRRYGITNPAIAAAMVRSAPRPVPAGNATTVVQTKYPMAVVCHSNTGSPPFQEIPGLFQLDLLNKEIVFNQPVVQYFGSTSNLQTGGASTDGIPGDVKVFVLYKKADLEVACPADSVVSGFPVENHAGTYHTVDGRTRTEIYDLGDAWNYVGDTASIQELACMIHATIRDTVVSGTVPVHGKLGWALSLGYRLSIDADYGYAYATGWESLQAPIRAVELQWPRSGADIWRTALHLDNRRRKATGDRCYVHAAFGQDNLLGDVNSSINIGGLAVDVSANDWRAFGDGSFAASLQQGMEGGGQGGNSNAF